MGDKVRLLSDAIRLGATIHRQIYGNLFGWGYGSDILNPRSHPQVTGTCALGAALVAIGKMPESMSAFAKMDDPYAAIKERWTEPAGMMCPCPEKECYLESNIITIVTHLNDKHMWKRERIADWLEGLGL